MVAMNADRTPVKNHPGLYRRGSSFTFRVDGNWVSVPAEVGVQEAERLRNKYRLRPTLKAGSSTTVIEYAQDWLSTRELKPRARQEYERAVNTHLSPLHKVKLSQVTPAMIRQLIQNLTEDGLSANTVRSILTPLSSMFSTAVEDGLVDRHPVKSLARGTRPKQRTGRKLMLSQQQMQSVLTEDGQWGVYTALGLLAGLRQSEALALQWEDITDTHIRVRHQLGRDGTLVSLKGSDADDKARWVELSQTLKSKLNAHRLHTGRRGGFVLSTQDGGPQDHRNARRAWDKLKARHGIPSEVTYHQLRHNYASMLIAAGEDIVKVSTQLGHSDPSITMKVYSHEFTLARRAGSSANAIDKVVGL